MYGTATKLVLLLLLALGAGADATAETVVEGPEEDVAEINRVFARWGAARDAGDIDGILSVHHPDMLIMTRNQALYRGHEGVRDFYTQYYGKSSERRLLSDVLEMRIVGDVAFVIGRFLVLDEDVEDPGYYLILLRRSPGAGWLIYRDIDTPSPDGLALMAR